MDRRVPHPRQTRAATLASPVVALAIACGAPPEVAPPYTAEVLDYVGGGQYAVRAQPLPTLTDFRRLHGGAVQLHGGGAVRITGGETVRTEADLRRVFRVRAAEPLRLDYRVEGGVVRAHDYDTFAALSLYRAFERVTAFYRELGAPPAALAPYPAYFRGRIEVLVFPLLASSNAAYLLPAEAFLFLNDFLDGADVPLALNLGVVAHEFGHAMFQRLVWGERLPPWILEDWPDRALNQLRALDEGLADVFGAVLTDDARFVGRSVPRLLAERDLDAATPLRAEALAETALDSTGYDPYPLGSLVASALWAAGARLGKRALAAYVLAAEAGLAGRIDRDFTLALFVGELVRVASPEHRAILCPILSERLPGLGPLPGCAEPDR